MVRGSHDKVTEFNIKPTESWFRSVSQCFSCLAQVLCLAVGGEEEGWPRRDGWWVRCCQTGGVKGQRILWFSITLWFSPVTVMAVCLWSCLPVSSPSSILLSTRTWLRSNDEFLFVSSFHPLHLPSWLYFPFFLIFFFFFFLWTWNLILLGLFCFFLLLKLGKSNVDAENLTTDCFLANKYTKTNSDQYLSNVHLIGSYRQGPV